MEDLEGREEGERRLWATIFSTSFQHPSEQDSLALAFALVALGRCVAMPRLSFLKIPPPPRRSDASLAKREIWVLCDASNATLTASSAPAPAPAPFPRPRSPYSAVAHHHHHRTAPSLSFLPSFLPSFLGVKIGIACWHIHREAPPAPSAPKTNSRARNEDGRGCGSRDTPYYTGRSPSRRRSKSHLFCLLSTPRTHLYVVRHRVATRYYGVNLHRERASEHRRRLSGRIKYASVLPPRAV